MPRLGPFDRVLFVRTAALALLVAAFALCVILATDEPFSTPAMRATRLGAFSPGLGALAALVALGQARARGELVALGALGAPPWRVALGAIGGAWVVGCLGALVCASPLGDASALFPTVSTPVDWLAHGTQLFDRGAGVGVAPDGSLLFFAPSAVESAAFRATGITALLAVLPLALATGVWAAAPLGAAARTAGALTAAAMLVVLLHAVAAGRIPSAFLPLAALPLVAQALTGVVRTRTA